MQRNKFKRCLFAPHGAAVRDQPAFEAISKIAAENVLFSIHQVCASEAACKASSSSPAIFGNFPFSWSAKESSRLDDSPADPNVNFALFERETEESGPSGALYYNLLENPERYTGYSGGDANRIWHAIYLENCHYINEPIGSNFSSAPNLGGLDNVFEPPPPDVCLERTLFYRVISGMHTSVSTHLSYKYFNESSGLFEPNIFEYQHRVGLYPERKANFFLTFVVLFRAIQKISPIIHSNYDFRLKESPDDEQKTKDIFQKISKLSLKCPNLFNEKLLFNTKSNPDALLLKQSLRDHFQNISRILDCVGCQRCRLWGKIQIIGLGTALKILFSYPEDITKCSLSRVELVALYNTLGKYSETLFFIQRLDSLVAESGVSGEKTEAPTSWNDVAFSCLLAFIFALLLLVFCSCLYIRYRKGAIKACSLSCSSESAENSIYALNENSPLKTHGSTGRLQKRLNRSTGSLFEEEEE